MIFLISMILIESILLVIAIIYLLKFSKILLNFEDNFTQALDVLDESYKNINRILKRPLFYDSPEIKYVLSQIRVAHDSILVAASSIANVSEIRLLETIEKEEQIKKIKSEKPVTMAHISPIRDEQ